MTPDAGLTLRLSLRAERIASVEIASTRFDLPPALTVGRTPDFVAGTLPRLYSVCAHAQGAAAAAALDAAGGRSAGAAVQQQRDAAVCDEAIVEHLTRLLLDWPRTMDLPPDIAAVACLRAATAGERRDIAQRAVYGVAPGRWLAIAALPQLVDWAERTATLPARVYARLQREAGDLGRASAAALLPSTSDALLRDLARRLREPGYGRRPQWRGEPAETGALARHAAHPLLHAHVERHGLTVASRLLARLVELAVLLDGSPPRPLTRSIALRPGVGIGAAETARGLLLHCAQVADGVVHDYRVLAPTEWNFHPYGAVAQALLRRAAPTQASARRDATWLVQALDPCVACRIDVHVAQAAGEAAHA